MSTILTDVGTFFTQVITWFGDFAEVVISQPILLIFLVAIPVVSFIVAIVMRVLRRRGR